jgi:hypothetical protein
MTRRLFVALSNQSTSVVAVGVVPLWKKGTEGDRGGCRMTRLKFSLKPSLEKSEVLRARHDQW